LGGLNKPYNIHKNQNIIYLSLQIGNKNIDEQPPIIKRGGEK
jgi:hypothetical protein